MNKDDLFGPDHNNPLPEMFLDDMYQPENPTLQPDEVPFVVVPTTLIYNNKLNSQELRLLIMVLNLYNRKKKIPCYASNSWFAQKLEVSEKTIANMISDLSKRKLLTIYKRSYLRYLSLGPEAF